MKTKTKKKKSGKELAPKKPKGAKVLRTIELPLSETEIAKRAKEAAKLSKEKRELLIEKKMATEEFSSGIKDRTARIDTLMKEVDTGREEREVSCIETMNDQNQMVEYYFEGKIVDRRPMTFEDKQEKMPFKAPAKTDDGISHDDLKNGATLAPPKPEVDKACVAPAPKKPPRKRQQLKLVEPQTVGEEVGSIIKEETNRRTKSSSVDGPTA